MKKVSVVITCYNYAKYLAGCLNSVLGQSFQDFEIILVNDGSTDNTDEVIAPFLHDSRIKYIKQYNSGQANAKNTGVNRASGELIAFLDADDKWDFRKLEKQVPLFHDPHVGVVYSLCRLIDENDRVVDLQLNLEHGYLRPRSGMVTEYLLFDNFVPFSSSIVRRECFNGFGIFNETLRMGIDWDLWLRISTQYQFQYVDQSLMFYRIGHPGHMSKNIDVRLKCADLITAQFLKKYPGFISSDIVQKAEVYKYLNRGYNFRRLDVRRSLYYYMQAIKKDPINREAWIGIGKTVVIGIFSKKHA